MKTRVFNFPVKETQEKIYLLSQSDKKDIDDVLRTLSSLFYVSFLEQKDFEIPYLGTFRFQGSLLHFVPNPALKESFELVDNEDGIEFLSEIFDAKISEKLKSYLEG